MTHIQIVTVFFILLTNIFPRTQEQTFPWFSGSFIDAKSTAGEKIIMIDFYTEW